MKKLINATATVLADALKGVAAAHPDLTVDFANRVVSRGSAKQGKVALISGGGSGHEPLHSGFVGLGMLDAACAGEIFTSPTPDQMLAAATTVSAGAGVLYIVKNYTGDVLNFEMAAELAEAEGVPVKTVLVADDVAVEDSTWTAGRRGVGTTVLVEKIAGAAAEEGRDLDAVHAIATRVSENGRSMGVALTSATLPAVGKPSFDLPEDEIEMGVGSHGEPGRTRRGTGDVDPVGPRLHGCPRDRAAQRPRRHAPHRALRDVRRHRRSARAARHHRGPRARGRLHHESRHGRLLTHVASCRRRDVAALGRTGQHRRAPLGGLGDDDAPRQPPAGRRPDRVASALR
jgi:dihydroxyacetone kinase